MMLDPHATMAKLVASASVRAERPLSPLLTSAALGGAYLSFGGCFFLLVGGTHALHPLLAAAVFPTGLSLILLTGTDLLTSNFMYGTLSFFAGGASAPPPRKLLGDAAYLWGASWCTAVSLEPPTRRF